MLGSGTWTGQGQHELQRVPCTLPSNLLQPPLYTSCAQTLSLLCYTVVGPDTDPQYRVYYDNGPTSIITEEPLTTQPNSLAGMTARFVSHGILDGMVGCLGGLPGGGCPGSLAWSESRGGLAEPGAQLPSAFRMVLYAAAHLSLCHV